MSVQALSCAIAVRGVSASEKLLLLVLANYADDKMTCWPSHKKMAAEACLTERTILSLLKSLEAKRFISRKERFRHDGSRTTDAITLHFSGEVISPPGESDNTGVGKSTTGGGAQISPLTTFEPSEEPSLTLVSVSNETAEPASLYATPDAEAWGEGVVVLVAEANMPPQAARKFIGGLLSQYRLEPRDLLPAIASCKATSTPDPKALMVGHCKAIARRRQPTGPPVRVSFV